MSVNDNNKSGMLSRVRNSLSGWHTRFPTIVFSTLFFLGIIFWGGFNWAMEMTNSESFCISCHEMEENVYKEYRTTSHYSNRTGVRATCPDCHVPKEWNHMVIRKISATKELFQKLKGTIDTREKFLDRRPHLVKKVWDGMRKSQSRECRNCHDFLYMDTSKQQTAAGQIHARANTQDQTCIDCHMGITHELPEQLIETEHLRFEEENQACGDCHVEMARLAEDEDWDWDD
jgi:cytochrome c-type protein NapC